MEEEKKVKEIRKIRVIPFAIIIACISAIINLIITVIWSSILYTSMSMMPMPYAINYNAMIVGILSAPVIGFIVGFIISGLAAVIYNYLSPKIGGIKVEVK